MKDVFIHLLIINIFFFQIKTPRSCNLQSSRVIDFLIGKLVVDLRIGCTNFSGIFFLKKIFF